MSKSMWFWATPQNLSHLSHLSHEGAQRAP